MPWETSVRLSQEINVPQADHPSTSITVHIPTRQDYLEALMAEGEIRSEDDLTGNLSLVEAVHRDWLTRQQIGCVYAQRLNTETSESASGLDEQSVTYRFSFCCRSHPATWSEFQGLSPDFDESWVGIVGIVLGQELLPRQIAQFPALVPQLWMLNPKETHVQATTQESQSEPEADALVLPMRGP